MTLPAIAQFIQGEDRYSSPCAFKEATALNTRCNKKSVLSVGRHLNDT